MGCGIVHTRHTHLRPIIRARYCTFIMFSFVSIFVETGMFIDILIDSFQITTLTLSLFYAVNFEV